MIRLLVGVLAMFLPCFSELITVRTSRGAVQGFDQDFGDDRTQRYYGYGQMFLGIPFAKPPVGEKRFQLPEDICQYNDDGDVHNATYYRSKCWQLKNYDDMSEDCLYLNVMTPNVTGTYPVMVFIHGGGFTTGSADRYHWKGAVRNLVSRGVVVVTIQYRLSVFGFFTTFTENFPPNRGLYDQILALRWVKDEIANFGGDSEKITVFGQSAGAVSVADLSLSPLSQGLFHQLIETSGSTLVELETIDDPRGSIHQDRASQICKINATGWGSEEKDQALLDCLLKATPEELVAFDFSNPKNWNAAIDGAILPDYPEKLAQSRPKYPVLLGDILDDYATFMPGYLEHDLSNVTSQSNQYFLQLSWPNYDDATAKKFSDIMIAGFSNGVTPADNDHLGWAKLINDMNTGLAFSSMMIRDAQWHLKAGNEDVWLFTFTFSSMLPFGVEFDGWIPVTHGFELPYLWFYPNVWETYNATEGDFAVADYMGQIWTDFAKNGALAYPRAGDAMNYIDIGDVITEKTNWRQTADEVYNHEIPREIGEFPPLHMSEEDWTTVRELGDRIMSKWNSMQCPKTSQASTESTTSRGPTVVPSLFTMILILLFV